MLLKRASRSFLALQDYKIERITFIVQESFDLCLHFSGELQQPKLDVPWLVFNCTWNWKFE